MTGPQHKVKVHESLFSFSEIFFLMTMTCLLSGNENNDLFWSHNDFIYWNMKHIANPQQNIVYYYFGRMTIIPFGYSNILTINFTNKLRQQGKTGLVLKLSAYFHLSNHIKMLVSCLWWCYHVPEKSVKTVRVRNTAGAQTDRKMKAT